MVKNLKGGSSHKSQARKHAQPSVTSSSKTRLANEGEKYAQVIKLLGNGMCHVLCDDGNTRLCIIRGKFKYRGRRDNNVTNNSWVLIGLRDFETEKSNKMCHCDLLEIYSDRDKENLKVQETNINWRKFIMNDNLSVNGTIMGEEKEEYFIFSDEKEDEYREIREKSIKEASSSLNSKIDFSLKTNKNVDENEEEYTDEVDVDEVNIDDI
jgi:initiation factor 1A